MSFLPQSLITPGVVQTVFVLSLVCVAGIYLGRVRIKGIALGMTFVFFCGIVASALGVQMNRDMVSLAQSFGLIIFIYTLGLEVGPGFFATFKSGGIKLNMFSIGLIFVDLLMMACFVWLTPLPFSHLMGLLCGAVTNTPMLGAAQETLLSLSPDSVSEASDMALSCAIAYPMGVIGMIIAIILMRALSPKENLAEQQSQGDTSYVGEFHVSNPGLFGRTIRDIASSSEKHFVISRLWRGGKVIIPTGESIFEKDDHLLVVCDKTDVDAIAMVFGGLESKDWNRPDIDWNAIDRHLISKDIYVTQRKVDGLRLGALKLRNAYGINITRIHRADIVLVASPELRLQLGDLVTVVGDATAIHNVEKVLGNERKELSNPNLPALFIGLALGVLLGSISFKIPGMSMPVQLGIAGGPIIVGILMGYFGPHFHITTYTTRSASLMLRQIGLTIFLAGLGLLSGSGFFEKVFCAQGLIWVLVGLSFTIVPVMLVAFVAERIFGISYAKSMGLLCGSMANPMALEYGNTTVKSDEASISYATVYPLAIFLRVITAQIMVILFC